MPELPEVEKAAGRLRRAAVGKTILAVKAIHPALRRKFTPSHARAAKGKRIESIERRGKHQLLHLESGDTLIVHFRMNGDWKIGASTDPLDRFARATIDLIDGTRISLVDRRALSAITLDKPGKSSLPRLGLEASDPAMNAVYLVDVLARKKIAIKPALMDQAVVAGLGNIYAAEALWEAKLDPRRPASKVTRPKTREAGRRNQTRPQSEEAPPRALHGQAGRRPVRGLRSGRAGMPALRGNHRAHRSDGEVDLLLSGVPARVVDAMRRQNR